VWFGPRAFDPSSSWYRFVCRPCPKEAFGYGWYRRLLHLGPRSHAYPW
jgi:hypothetical protein